MDKSGVKVGGNSFQIFNVKDELYLCVHLTVVTGMLVWDGVQFVRLDVMNNDNLDGSISTDLRSTLIGR